MPYGNGWKMGDKVTVVAKKFKDGVMNFDSRLEHPNLIGKTGEVVFVEDDGYDSPNPHGYERVTLYIQIDGQEHQVDSAYCMKTTMSLGRLHEGRTIAQESVEFTQTL